jgi:hypothetical protein
VISTSGTFIGSFVLLGGEGEEDTKEINERMHQCTTLNTTGIYKNSFFGKYAYERLLFFKLIPELGPKLEIFLPAKLLISFLMSFLLFVPCIVDNRFHDTKPAKYRNLFLRCLHYNITLNPLKTKRILHYLQTQFLPHSKHFSTRL